MEAIFLRLVKQSIAASGFIFIVLVVRLCFRRLSGNVRCILWALVAVSLVLPLSLRIPLPIKTASTLIHTLSAEKSLVSDTFLHLTEGPDYRLPDNPVTEKSLDGSMVAAVIWLLFRLAFLIYMLLAQILLYKKLRVSFLTKDNYRICDQISDAFVIGVVHPCIYLPSDLDPACTKFILAHEKAHISRRDFCGNRWGIFFFRYIVLIRLYGFLTYSFVREFFQNSRKGITRLPYAVRKVIFKTKTSVLLQELRPFLTDIAAKSDARKMDIV